MNEAILFPGQGAQFAGMGRDFCERFPTARAVFEDADRALGFALTKKCWDSGDEVNRTDVAQPGIFTTSVAVIRVLEERGLDRKAVPFTAGLSLGEYTALWCAGSLELEGGVRRVPFASNVTGEISEDTAAIRRQLAEQVCAPVLWERSMRVALARGIRSFLEPAPGTVLAGIFAKIDPEAQVRAVAKPEDVVG